MTAGQLKRFERYTKRSEQCWIWTGAKKRGYGTLDQVGSHRLAYLHFRGPIPTGLILDHLCRVRNCVNPWHLEAVTHKENILRGVGLAAINAKKTACKRGHPFTPDNIYGRRGWRQCRECSRIAWRQWALETGYKKPRPRKRA